MKIRYELTEDDYIQFNLYHMQNSPSQKKTFMISRYLLPLLLAIPIYLFGTLVFKQPSLFWIIIAVLYTVIWMVTFPKLFKRNVTKAMKKMAQEGDNSNFYGLKTLEIEDDKIIATDDTTTSIVLKSAIKDIKVYDDMVLLYESAISAHIIPTRSLSNEKVDQLLKELSNGQE